MVCSNPAYINGGRLLGPVGHAVAVGVGMFGNFEGDSKWNGCAALPNGKVVFAHGELQT